MAISVVMPALEMGQETGRLVAWLKQEGEIVRMGDPLLEVETDKAVLEVEACADGVLTNITGEVGEEIAVGHIIAWIVSPRESVPRIADGASVSPPTSPPQQELARTTSVSEPPAASAGPASPRARRLAKEHGIDVGKVRGSGPGGEIQVSDIQAIVDARSHQETPTAAAVVAPTSRDTASAIGRLMAERTAQSWTTIPHFFLQRDVDATGLNRARATLGAAVEPLHGVKLTHTDLFVALVARMLVKHPLLNASWNDDGIRMNPDINVAIAMAVDDGVVAGVVTNAERTLLSEVSKQRHELTDRARGGRLRPADIIGGTFTISNLGMFQVDSFCAIIIPPQAAILAVGAIVDRVVPLDGGIGIRPMVSLTLSADHRVIDGRKAAAFLKDLAGTMQEPEKWLV
jgi:pyruvate dehydrogenase E2 component (dihydrolipoamide acetyltransferase)